MELDCAFGLSEFGPWEQGKTEVDGCCVKQVELSLKLEFVLGGKLLAAMEQLEEQGLIQGGWLLLVDPGQGCPGCWAQSEMIQLVCLGLEVLGQVTQAFLGRKLSDHHGKHLAPPVVTTELLADMMILCQGIKFMSRKNCSNLVNDRVIMCHGSELLVL